MELLTALRSDIGVDDNNLVPLSALFQEFGADCPLKRNVDEYKVQKPWVLGARDYCAGLNRSSQPLPELTTRLNAGTVRWRASVVFGCSERIDDRRV